MEGAWGGGRSETVGQSARTDARALRPLDARLARRRRRRLEALYARLVPDAIARFPRELSEGGVCAPAVACARDELEQLYAPERFLRACLAVGATSWLKLPSTLLDDSAASARLAAS